MGISLKSLFSWTRKQKPVKDELLEERLKSIERKTSQTLTGISMLGMQTHTVAEKVKEDCSRPRLPTPQGASNGSAPSAEMPDSDSVASKVESAKKSVMFMRGEDGKLAKIV